MSAPYRLRLLEEASSTNDLAREAALAGEPADLWIVARSQSGGRGRLGRPWRSPPGNFYGSLILRLEADLATASTLSLVAGLAVAETIHELSGGRLAPRLKWPNDVLIDGAKLAGILVEGAMDGQGCWLVIGIGVNLESAPADLPYPATSLRAAGLPALSPEAFLAVLDGCFRGRLRQWREGGFPALREAWLTAAMGIGQLVKIRQGEREREGRLADLAGDGAILVEFDGGAMEHFTAGEIVFQH
ncbi:BirA family transcriptional regulator, biotin operon repressor / biotin-[acetyl-CoA-carboxylase] ligase [Arboricoccus pini]|uniref:biotin--[biotin carboxyl-carrier protein] ligase n=1 Tax=Arboricoccus pini TaxID=1963835 RepID=A0A212PWI6_9PROT|nr:biotin--[acetyl-CoA-carboxylase] ligase [Arboricoccus pini]SNB51305.1 BirA family transcriptional regulator, biotin operon repressor / biotin-[acetyl-CoA-carboxylase] ligase [Arboricoccus pini]